MKTDTFRSKTNGGRSHTRHAQVETKRGFGGRFYTTVTLTKAGLYRTSVKVVDADTRAEGLKMAKEFVA